MSVAAPHVIGRYSLCGEIAAGGMATVHYGRLVGPAGFARTVAIKRLHAQFARDPEFASMFLDEARLAGRIHHPNVVQTIDVVALDGELFLVMDYIPGEALSRLLRAAASKGERLPFETVSSILCGVLHGLHAAHEAKAETGEPLGIVHRDVSPQNILVGTDGIPRVLDFGVAKAAGRAVTTREGQVKGKFAYMAPEQVASGDVDRRTDVYAAGVVLWEMLTLQRLFPADNDAQLLNKVVHEPPRTPSSVVPGIPKGLDAIALRALAKHPGARFADARQMALELEAAAPLASPTRVASWLEGLAHATLAERAKSVAQIESHSSGPYPALREVLRDSMTPTPAPAPLTELQATLVTDPKASLAMAHSSRPSLQVEAASGRRLPGLLYALAAAALVIGSVALGGVIRTRSAAGDAAHAPIPGETSSVVSAAATPSEVRAEGSRPPTAAAVDAASVVAPATAPIPSALAKPPATVRPPPRPKAAAVSPSEGDLGGGHCTIKSFVDESGIEHFTKDCN